VHVGIVVCVEVAEQDQARCPCDCEEDREDTEEFLGFACVSCKAACVSEPALRDDADVEEDDRDNAAAYEKRFELEGAYVGDVGYILALFHRRVMFVIEVC